jgi:hypothetical protein
MRSPNECIRQTLAVAALLALAACEPQPPAPSIEPDPPSPAQQAAAEAEASDDDSCAPIAELDALDPRTPVPLQPMMAWHQKQNMQEHLVAIQRITAGLAREDWDEVASASALIESSPQMQQMCRHMGAGADGFTELALDFHRRADAIGEAARARDTQAVLRATSHTLQACTSCHSTYRQDVVDAETWTERAGREHQPAMGHHGMHGMH